MNNIKYSIIEVEAVLIGVRGVAYKYKENIIIIVNSNTINKNVLRLALIEKVNKTDIAIL